MGPEAQRNSADMASRRTHASRRGISGVASALLQDRHSRVMLKYDMEIHRSQYLRTQRRVGPPVPRMAILFLPVGHGLRLVEEPMTSSARVIKTQPQHPPGNFKGAQGRCLRPTTSAIQHVRCAWAAGAPSCANEKTLKTNEKTPPPTLKSPDWHTKSHTHLRKGWLISGHPQAFQHSTETCLYVHALFCFGAQNLTHICAKAP